MRVHYILRNQIYRKKVSVETNEIVKPEKANKYKKGGGNYDFDETFDETVVSLKKLEQAFSLLINVTA